MTVVHRAFDIFPYTDNMLELLFDQMPLGVVVISTEYRVLRYNAVWVGYFERYNPAVAARLQPGLGYFVLLPEFRAVLEPLIKSALHGETVREHALGITLGENTSYWNIVAAPLIRDGSVTGVLLVSSDVTEQVEAEQALERALRELECSNAVIEQRVDERTRELQTLITVQQALTSSLNLNDVLQIISREARRLTHTGVGAVFLPSNEGLVLAALSSEHALDIHPGYRMSLTDSITGTAFRTGQTQLVTDITHHPHVDPNAFDKARLQDILSVPLKSGARVIGVLSVGNKNTGVLNAEDERLLALMIPSAVIALENVHVYERASETAVAAERGRLARDLHDSVTQTLFSASLTAEVLPRIWARDPAEGVTRLEKLRELTRGALAEMRTLLLELRPAALAEMPLGDLLRQLAEGIVGRTRIEIEVAVTGERDLAPEVKTAFYRIAQEALNNVAKHSKAKAARITLTYGAQQVDLTVADDGIGFDPDANRANHLGLRIMAERADAIGAVLRITTTIDHGTQIDVRWSEQERM